MFCFQSSYHDDKVSSRSILIARCLYVCVCDTFSHFVFIWQHWIDIGGGDSTVESWWRYVSHSLYLVSNEMLCECYCLKEVVPLCIFTWWHWSRTKVNVRSLVQTLRALCTTTTFFKMNYNNIIRNITQNIQSINSLISSGNFH